MENVELLEAYMVNKFMLTLSCVLLTAAVSAQASRFAIVNFTHTVTIEFDTSAIRSIIINRISYLGYDELGYFAKRLYVNNAPTVTALSNTECAVFGIGAIVVAALIGYGLYSLRSKPSNKEKQDKK